ncbi:non-ribosomal peptide synthetase [Hyalangium sp.]|uniref:non-ribosomal peptide synthetase n=1 Tax=Hyalangium sp. TaxID=2028555 RepID=UPI002D2EC546|nr:non-ribosomal peptide synthetase [Hyalangium sp.]HYH98167.1 amino acid adenylation domain-containing protein [Hyalangium sp.]
MKKAAEARAPRWPLSAAQRGVWVAQQLDPSNPRYNCGGYLEIHGPVEPALLEEAVRRAVAETEPLRVRFIEDAEGPWQILEPSPHVALDIIDVSSDRDPLQSADGWMRDDLLRPVDLGRGPLVHHALFRVAADRFLFYLRYHHIVMDGFGQLLYWRKVAELYSALARGRDDVATGFGSLQSLLEEDSGYRASPQFERDQKFWREKFAAPPETARLSSRATMLSRGLLRRTAHLSPSSTDKLRAAAQRAQTRWSVIVIAATAAYMHRLTGMEEIVLGLPVSTRLTPVSRSTPCMMANELPLRLTVHPTTTLGELVRQVSEQVGLVLKHQRYRGEDLQQEIRSAGGDRDLYGSVVNVVSFEHAVQFAEHPATAHYLSSGPVRELLIGFYGKSDASELQLYFDANPELFSANDLATHQQRFLRFLEAVTGADPAEPLHGLDLLLPGERQQLLEQLNATARPYDLSKCLHELIDEQARRTPDAPATAVAGGTMSYRELADRSDRLAAYLREQGVGAGQYVGVYEERSLELVVSLLAVLKAGAAYVPLDPELPLPRVEYQLRNANIRVVLSRSTLQGRLAGLAVERVPVDELLARLPALATPLPRAATPEDTAYVIYTSGSTGQPKGVAVPHRGVVNRLLWMQEEYHLGPADCVLQKTPFTFDVSVWEFFWPLLVGSRLFLAEPGAHRDPRYVARTIREQAVTTLHFVPPMLDLFLAEPESATTMGLRRVVCSGEALRPETVRAFFERFDAKEHGVELHNLYGPTEASIDVTYWKCSPEDATGSVPIGRPVANTSIYLLDQSGGLTPVGVPGELYIGGVQVASGYVNRPELTQERFVPNPFGPGNLYRTGDLARYRKDGAIEFLGRLDHQVKVRGFRIELGEIESALLSHPAVEQAVVTTWERTRGDRRLVAYVVARKPSVPAQEELVDFLARQLPEYMVPAHVLFLDALPLSPNGKIDRRALPEPTAVSAGPTALPATPEERLLHEVWREVLGLHQFGVEDSFFSLGGDSMQSIRVRAALEKRGHTFTIQELFRFPTIRELAKQLRPLDSSASGRARLAPFELVRAGDRARLPEGLEDAYPLSAMQAGMLFHAEFDDETAVYRVVTSLHVAARFDEAVLRRALADTFRRHPALRSSFDLSIYSEPLQLVHREVEVPLEIANDLGGLDEAAQRQTVREWIDRAKFRRFDPAAPPLLAFTVHRRGEGSFQLSVVEHHVVLDGWSDSAMLEEIVSRYRARLSGEELWLPAVPSMYQDFVAEERRILADEQARRFWKTLLEGGEAAPLPRRATLLGEQRRTTHRSFDVPLSAEVAERLRQAARQEALPLKALLATAHVAVLRRVCSSDEVITGVVSNGRLEEEGGDEVIGVFLNTLPLRVDTKEASLLSTARRIFEHERDSAPYRRYPFAQIQRDLGGALQLDSYVNFMDFHQQWHVGESADALILEGIGVAETNFPLAANFLIDPVHGRLQLWLDCDVSVLDLEFCERLTGYYRRALEAVASTPTASIAAVELMDRRELDLIAGWNDTAVAYDKALTVHGLIERQARRSAEAAALAHRWSQVSYAEMDARANQLAHQLRELGVRRRDLVGVSLRRSADLVISLLAVLKAGAAYVPLDPAFPKNRLEFIASDAGIHCLITERAGPAGITAERVVLVDADAARIAAQPRTSVESGASGDDPAYVIYTSGSTGKPKGTVVRHRNVVNFFMGMDARIGCGPQDVVLAVTSMSFDISVLELLWPLTQGAQVVVAGERLIKNMVRDEGLPTTALGFSLLLPGTSSAPLSPGSPSLAQQVASFAQQHGFGLARSQAGSGTPATERPSSSQQGEASPEWLSPTSSAESFERAGKKGLSVTTPLLGQGLDELAAKIKAYRRAREERGSPSAGRLSVLLPAFVLDDAEEARHRARAPFREYLRTSPELRPLLVADSDGEAVTDKELDQAVERYFGRAGLFGSPASTADTVRQLARIGADEVACQVDFGIAADDVVAGLSGLNALREIHRDEVAETEHSFADLCSRHRATLVQSTPSFLAAVVAEPVALESLKGARAVLVGGEAFPGGLAERLVSALPEVRIFNMYGPTETTIWSTVHELDPARDTRTGVIPIGKPIANTEVLVLDTAQQPVPIGVSGELWIGGDGVAGVYLNRPELTAERFPVLSSEKGQVYRTGDRARWRSDGLLEFLGRVDRQVKILGHRVEPDEVESVLSRHPQVASLAVVAVTKESGSAELVAFVSPKNDLVDLVAEDAHVKRWGEVWEGAYTDSETGARAGDPDRDFSGWASSYTGEPIPPAEMREWLGHTVGRITALQPRSVVDVGVGVGLVLRGVAPRVERYLGIDVSAAAVRTAAATMAGDSGQVPAHIQLLQGDASHLARLEPDTGSTVVMNSVIQYFPGTDYLERVLREAVRVVGARGAVFVGDVRDLDLLEAFHASVQLHRAPALMPVRELTAAVARQVAAERELCLSTGFFRKLPAQLGVASQVRIELKRGHAVNELTCFRYDVTLLGAERARQPGDGEVLPWSAFPGGPASLAGLSQVLDRTGATSGLTITGIPNRRLVRPLALVRLLREAAATDIAWEVERRLWEADEATAMDPEDVAALAEQRGRQVRLLVPSHGRLDEFDAVFEPREQHS